MSTNKKNILLGLAFPNAILFGFALIFFGCVGFYQTFWSEEYVVGIGLVLKTILLVLPILLGLVPITSTKHIVIDNEFIYSFNQLFSIIKVGSTFNINDYKGISVRKGNKVYKIESGLTPTAKSEYSLKLYDIILRDKNGNDTILVKNIGSQKKAKIVFDEILSRTDYEY